MDDEQKPRKPPVRRDVVADAAAVQSPWLNLELAAAYLFRSRRFVRKQIRQGKLRAALVGGKKEILTRREWCDDWAAEQAAPVPFPTRRRA
jgi:hypothetical protein